MHTDLLYQLMNPVVFLVFTAGFLAIDMRRDDKVARIAALAYAVGALAFVGDILFPTSESILIRTMVAGLYAVTAVLIVGAINLYYRKSFPWHFFAGFVAVHLGIYAWLLSTEADWVRSLAANLGCGLIFLLGMLRIKNTLATRLDKWVFIIGIVNAAVCIVRPVGLLILSGGTLSSATHSEILMITTLHVFIAFSAVLTAMSISIVLIRDIFRTLEQRSESDPLTSLLNRRGFEKYAAEILAAPVNKAASLIVIDLDHFKAINDNHGHAAGDIVIQKMAHLLKKLTTDQAISARLGGEEYAVLFSGVPLSPAKEQANIIREAFQDIAFDFDGKPASCTASMGVAEYKTGESIYGLLSRADDALYLAKSDNRNCVKCELDMAVHELRRARLSLENTANQVDPETPRPPRRVKATPKTR